MTNPFSRIHNEKWVIPVSGLSALLGFMLVVSWLNEDNRLGRSRFLTPDQNQRGFINEVGFASYVSMKEEVERLQKRATTLEKALSENGRGSATLNDQLQSAKSFAGLTELVGGGVKVTLAIQTRVVKFRELGAVPANTRRVGHVVDHGVDDDHHAGLVAGLGHRGELGAGA